MVGLSELRISISSSTHSTPSARPARLISRARRMRAGAYPEIRLFQLAHQTLYSALSKSEYPACPNRRVGYVVQMRIDRIGNMLTFQGRPNEDLARAFSVSRREGGLPCALRPCRGGIAEHRPLSRHSEASGRASSQSSGISIFALPVDSSRVITVRPQLASARQHSTVPWAHSTNWAAAPLSKPRFQ
jgi:hypothetical protein